MDVKLISKVDILRANCINYDEIIKAIENVFIEFDNHQIILPEKTSQIFDESTQNRINCMPSTLLKQGVSGVKWVSVFPGNPKLYGVPNVSGVIILSELVKGYPFAIMDGSLITAVRTACMGAVGAKYLAREDSNIYCSIGAGEQARMHFRAIKHLFPKICVCNVASRTSESEKNFIQELSIDYPDVQFIQCFSDYGKASKNADIIVTAVSCQEPLLKANSIKEGAFYCHVGGWEDEYDVPLKADKIVCDNWEALKHRGSPTIAKLYQMGRLKDSDIYCNIKDLISGKKKGRENEREFNYFNSIGLSFVDLAVAKLFYDKVTSQGFGQKWSIF